MGRHCEVVGCNGNDRAALILSMCRIFVTVNGEIKVEFREFYRRFRRNPDCRREKRTDAENVLALNPCKNSNLFSSPFCQIQKQVRSEGS